MDYVVQQKEDVFVRASRRPDTPRLSDGRPRRHLLGPQSRGSMCSPSYCYEGFIEDSRCPILLGSGFGPDPYQKLFLEWTDILGKDLTEENSDQKMAVKALLSRISVISPNSDEIKVHEGVLSGAVANLLQALLPTFSQNKSLCVLHQAFVPRDSSASVDIAITNSFDLSASVSLVHSLLEVKWSDEQNKFPEAQACACARCFAKSGSLLHEWVPIFVLSRTHLQCGLGFQGQGGRWYYSEIFVYRKGSVFSPDDANDARILSKFSNFLFRAADFTASYVSETDNNFVDRTGAKLLMEQSLIIGHRVLKGVGADGVQKTLKFYTNESAASQALENQKLLEDACGDGPCAATLRTGCGPDGMCAILDNYINSASRITYHHMKNLTEKVGKFQEGSLIHGDLRVQNIIFGQQNAVYLIDFEWAGKFGVAKFPTNANHLAFGSRAKLFVDAGSVIPKNFDWICLADILDRIGCLDGADAAMHGDKTRIIEILDSLQLERVDVNLYDYFAEPRFFGAYLNLSCISKRVRAFHNAELEIKRDASGKLSKKRKRGNSHDTSELTLSSR